jgi:hypothetical protein
VHPAQRLTTEISFIFEIKGEGRFPIGEKLGSGIMTKYSHGIIDAASRNSFFDGLRPIHMVGARKRAR